MRKVPLKNIIDANPAGAYVNAVLHLRTRRLRDAVDDRDVGASAIELAIITAVLVGLAVAVLFVVSQVVTTRKGQITSRNNGVP